MRIHHFLLLLIMLALAGCLAEDASMDAASAMPQPSPGKTGDPAAPRTTQHVDEMRHLYVNGAETTSGTQTTTGFSNVTAGRAWLNHTLEAATPSQYQYRLTLLLDDSPVAAEEGTLPFTLAHPVSAEGKYTYRVEPVHPASDVVHVQSYRVRIDATV